MYVYVSYMSIDMHMKYMYSIFVFDCLFLGMPLGPGPGPKAAHKGQGLDGPRGPSRDRPTRAQWTHKGLAHKSPEGPTSTRARSTRAPGDKGPVHKCQ